MGRYGELLRLARVREALVLGFLLRTPMWAMGVALTLHVVGPLHRSYGMAGLVEAASTVAAAISGPVRGRRLDRVGLRATILPSLVVIGLAWAVAPRVGYWWLLVLVSVAGLFMLPGFSAIRQVLMGAASTAQRRTVLTLDAVMTEATFMVGPVLGVLGVATVGSAWTLTIGAAVQVLSGLLLFWRNPPLRSEADEAEAGAAPAAKRWVTPTVLAILAASVTSSLVLTGSDLGVVAAMRSLGHYAAIGWVLAVWGLASAVGGLVYGAMHRSLSSFGLLALLAVATVPVALAGTVPVFALLIFVAGLFCAPTLTACLDQLSHAVPVGRRGEAMGWHASAMTGGGALGAPLVGLAVDHAGWQAAFLVSGGLGLAAAAAGASIVTVRRRRDLARGPADPPAAQRYSAAISSE